MASRLQITEFGGECQVNLPVERISISASPDISVQPLQDEMNPVTTSRAETTIGATSVPQHHVLYVIDQLCQLGGAERMLLEMVKRLSRERFRCSVVTFKLDPSLDCLKDLPAIIHVLPLGSTHNLQAAKTAWQLRRLIRQENVSIVHTFFETSDLWAAPVAKISGCPIVISSRRDMGILRNRKHHLAYPIVNRVFDLVLAVSNEVRSYAVQHDGIAGDRVETLYNGVDLAELDSRAIAGDVREQLGLSAGTPVISTLANIRVVKGIDVLARAAKIVCAEFPDAIFLVIGRVLEPETMSALQIEIESLGLTKNIRFVGAMTNPFPALRASNLFCLPSRNEGFSNALLEAMGCRLTSVATRVGGNAEAIKEAQNGFLVDSEDASSMAERILQLLRDPALAERMGQAARETVEARFSLDAMMSRLTKFYDDLLVAKHV